MNRVVAHICIYGKRGMRDEGVGECSNERIANENMGSRKNLGEEEKSGVEETMGLTRSDELKSDGENLQYLIKSKNERPNDQIVKKAAMKNVDLEAGLPPTT
ncbi:uncharacterized protein G2W53_043947 [Senna tora]|uniref:Uncharacterized protein n=1 Tax=Senna tora TaxID=362788 RepID=A0A834SK23_9FABA|nr:uncharacterized protein G2W53_043947 [Senna tora]